VAVADNASAGWYNPAAMTELDGNNNVSLGAVSVNPRITHDYTGGSDAIANVLHVPPSVYAAHKVSDKVSIGFGANLPYGMSTDWDTKSKAANIATYSNIRAFNYNLNGAYKVDDKLSVAAGADYMYMDAKLDNSGMALNGTGNGWGYNAAAFYKFNDKWNFGANYRSPIKVDINGTAKIAALGAAGDNDASTSITLPDTFQAGAAYKVNQKWMASFTADYTDWATYHALTVKSQTIAAYTWVLSGHTFSTDTMTENKDWQSVWGFHAGTQYKYSDEWNFTAGTFYDYNPVKAKNFDTIIPDADRLAFSIGAGWTHGNIVANASYTYVFFMHRKISEGTNADGTYKSYAQLPAISVGYKF
jgi:long-chain fatty acid transport protein